MIKKISDETRVKAMFIGFLGAAVYNMGIDLLWVNDLSAIWFAALGLFGINFGFFTLEKGE